MKVSRGFTRPVLMTGAALGIIVSAIVASDPVSAAHTRPYIGTEPRPVCSATPIRSVRTTQKVVALTFDDGPWPTNTLAVTNHLAQYNAKATFFMVGNNVARYPTIVQEVYRRGHEVAGHAKTHANYTPAGIASEIMPGVRDIFKATGNGVQIWAFRPPGLTRGAYIDRAVASYRLCNVHTDYDIGDWKSPRIPAATICQRFRNSLHPGYIALLHDGGSHTPTVKAMPCILAHAKSQGYKFVTVSQLLNMGTHVH